MMTAHAYIIIIIIMYMHVIIQECNWMISDHATN